MAKGQKRSNREIKKPKAVKPAVDKTPTSGSAAKSSLDRIAPGNKKH